MTTLPNEFVENLTSIETIKTFLAGLVAAAFESGGNVPVRLTYIGGEFAKSVGSTFEKRLNVMADEGKMPSLPRSQRKLAQFIEAYCTDIFEISQDPAGVYFVSPKSDGASQAAPVERAHATLRFHRAVWAAFIRPIEGKRRFLNLDQIGFTDTMEKPTTGNWHEIPKTAVLGVASGVEVDGVDLQNRIEQWAGEAGVPISQLVLAPKPSHHASRRADSCQLDRLLDLIDSLPPDIAAHWSIPADVLQHLRNAR